MTGGRGGGVPRGGSGGGTFKGCSQEQLGGGVNKRDELFRARGIGDRAGEEEGVITELSNRLNV